MINAIKKRRAVREYLNEPVSDDKIQELLNTVACAPSANALYPWELVIVKDHGTKELLSKVTPWATFAKEAAVIIAVVGHKNESPEWIEDCSIVAEHLWLEATEQGLGACWIQIRNQGNADDNVKSILNIPSQHGILCLMAIGVPAKPLPEHDLSIISKNKFKYEKYK
ncbi:MAG: nitroreductase family protein [Candidatus Buchananbacteria bacterium]